MTVEVVTFGCRLNKYESELIKQNALDANLSNIVIINSCAVTSEAERKLRQSIRRIKRKKPNAEIVITGCAAQINPSKYEAMPEVTKVMGNNEKLNVESYKNFIQHEEKVLVNDIMSITETAPQFIHGIESKTRAFLQVQNGCNHRCTFCIIPYGRGNSRSIGVADIVKQAEILSENGYKEIVLTGVDITDYGLDLPGTPTLGQMVKRLLIQVPEIKVRLSSIDVAEIDSDLLQLIANESRFMPHLHLSLQSGDDLILKRMKRRHSRRQVIDFCNNVMMLRPEVAFGADIIVGFPTETEEMFQNTLKIVEESNITYLHVFPYSERDGTPAARMPQVEIETRKERALRLRNLGDSMLEKHYKNHLNNKLEVLLEGNGWGRSNDFSLIQVPTNFEAGAIKIFDITGYTKEYLVGSLTGE